jgi:hypothetical protein
LHFRIYLREVKFSNSRSPVLWKFKCLYKDQFRRGFPKCGHCVHMRSAPRKERYSQRTAGVRSCRLSPCSQHSLGTTTARELLSRILHSVLSMKERASQNFALSYSQTSLLINMEIGVFKKITLLEAQHILFIPCSPIQMAGKLKLMNFLYPFFLHRTLTVSRLMVMDKTTFQMLLKMLCECHVLICHRSTYKTNVLYSTIV